MWHKQKNKNPIVRLALLLVLASTPMMTSLLKSDYVLAQSATETPSFPLPTEVEKGTTIRVDGSASMTKANELLKQRFEKEYPGANVEVATNGTDDALEALNNGDIDIAAIGRGLTPEEEAQGLQQQRLRREKIAIIVGKDNPFKGDLSNQRFTDIYTGKITDWSEIGGSPGKIRVIDRPDISDTREAFRNYPLFRDNFETGSNATQLDSDDPAEVVNQLGNDGIGFVLANQVSKLDNVRILSMHKTLPTDPRYPYSQPLVYVFKQNPSAAVKDFVGFATAEPGQQALEEASELEATAVAQAVAQTSNNGNATTATPAATPGAATTDANTENVGAATNASASDNSATGNQAFLPRDTAGASSEVGGRIPLWLILLLPVAILGALILWWMLGRRKSQEDDTVARGVLPADSPPPFTPTTTSGTVKEPEPVVNEPVEPAVTTTEGINTAPVEPAPSTTPGINTAAISAGLAAAAMGSTDTEDTTDVSNNSVVASSELRLDAPDVANNQLVDVETPDVGQSDIANNLDVEAADLGQPDIANNQLDVEAADLEQPDIPDTQLDLEAPAAVVNSSYHSLPRISTPVDEVPATEAVDPPSSGLDSQENLPSASTNKWLGNFALGGAAAAGAEKIKSKFADKKVDSEPVADEIVSDAQPQQDNRAKEYAQLPDVWDAPEKQQPAATDEQENSSLPVAGIVAAGVAGLAGAAAVGSNLLNRGDNKSEDNDNAEEPEEELTNQETTPSDLWGTPQTQPVDPQESSLTNDATENVSNVVEGETTPSDLWETPQTQPVDPQESYENNRVESLEQLATDDVEATTFNNDNDAVEPLEEVEEAANDRPESSIYEGGTAAVGSTWLNQNNDTSDDSNNAVVDPVEEPTTDADVSNDNQQSAAPAIGAFGGGWFLNRFRKTTPNSDLPEVRIVPDTQLADAQATSNAEANTVEETTQETSNTQVDTVEEITQETSTQANTVEETTQETSEKQIAQFGVSSLETKPASTAGTVLAGGAALGAAALGSQMLRNDEESQQFETQVPEGEDVDLDQIADEAEIDTQIRTSNQESDAGDTDWDRIYGIHHNGATGVPGESNILLANRTPKWAYASWNIAPADREAMQSQGASQLVLRLYDVTNIDLSYQEAKLVQQYECEETVNHRYVAIPNADRDYITEIGYLTEDKNWLLVSRSPIVRVFSRPHKDFWFEADAELIIHGATVPGSTVNIDGQSIKVKQDGTFHLRVPFTESLIDYLITAVAPDSEQAKTLHMRFSQSERKDS